MLFIVILSLTQADDGDDDNDDNNDIEYTVFLLNLINSKDFSGGLIWLINS